jgi:hypothetical protein
MPIRSAARIAMAIVALALVVSSHAGAQKGHPTSSVNRRSPTIALPTSARCSRVAPIQMGVMPTAEPVLIVAARNGSGATVDALLAGRADVRA